MKKYGKRKDQELKAAYYYAQLRGAGRKEKTAVQLAAALISVSPYQFKETIWPKYAGLEGIKQAEELVRNPPDNYPEYF